MAAKKSAKSSVKGTRKRAPNYSEPEKAAALEMVIACGGNVAEASRKLGIAEGSLREWTRGVNCSAEVYADYLTNARARVQQRVEAIHASKDEVLSLYALHLRGDLADFDGLIGDDGTLDLKGAKEKGISRLIKKLRTIPTKTGGFIREIEFYSAKDAADALADVLGLRQKKGDNQADAEGRRRFWREQIERVSQARGLSAPQAREWLLANVPAAQRESEWIN